MFLSPFVRIALSLGRSKAICGTCKIQLYRAIHMTRKTARFGVREARRNAANAWGDDFAKAPRATKVIVKGGVIVGVGRLV